MKNQGDNNGRPGGMRVFLMLFFYDRVYNPVQGRYEDISPEKLLAGHGYLLTRRIDLTGARCNTFAIDCNGIITSSWR